MSEKQRDDSFNIIKRMLKIYDIKDYEQGAFFLQVDWLLENSVYPLESTYADNLIELWNVYMPGCKFDRVILEYSKKYFPVLRYVHDGEIFKFNSVKFMQEVVIKNYIKFCISQGETNRMVLVKECFDLLKDISDRTKLYDIINKTIEHYFTNGEIMQYSVMFLKRFQDYTNQPYIEVLDRLSDIYQQKEEALKARSALYNILNINNENEENFQTLINILLCKIAVSDDENRFSDILKNAWKDTFPNISYNDKVYAFIEKYEKPYMNAACNGIKNIKNSNIILQLYKDAIILCSVLEAVKKDDRHTIREITDFWKRDGMHFSKRIFFDDVYNRMKSGFNRDILIANEGHILTFHKKLLNKILSSNLYIKKSNEFLSEKRSNFLEKKDAYSEMNNMLINEKHRQIQELQDKIADLEEKLENMEKEVMSEFISLLDSKKYDYVLGKLYRTAYSDENIKTEDIRRILKNLFEIMNINGIDIYGKLGDKVSGEEIKRGKYRVESEILKDAIIKYPGYRMGNSVILHPLAEEVQ